MVFGLFVFLAVVLFVLACCLCCWMGDTSVPVSLYSHAWELTILTNRLMTVRTSKKKSPCAAPLLVGTRLCGRPLVNGLIPVILGKEITTAVHEMSQQLSTDA